MKLARGLYGSLLAHGERDYPEEACGFLVGDPDGTIVGVIPVTNAAARMKAERPEEFSRGTADGYVMDPREQLAAERRIENEGRTIAGVYHSHPDVGAYFSEEDRRRALPFDVPLYPLWIVADVRAGKGLGAKLFVWDDRAQDFLEQPLEIID